MKRQEMERMSMGQLVAMYNAAGPAKAVKKFANKATAIDRLQALTGEPSDNGKKDEKVESLKDMSSRSVRQVAEEKLLEEPILTYEQIILAVKDELPHAATSVACLRWYATQMRERGEKVPDRPRKPRGVTLLS